MKSELIEAIAQAIWSKTYLHDTLLLWSEIKPGTMHHKRVMEAAEAVAILTNRAHEVG